MSEPIRQGEMGSRLPLSRLVFLSTLVIAGAGLLGWAAVHQRAPQPTSPDVAEQARKYLHERHVVPLSGPLEAILKDPFLEPMATQQHPLLGGYAPLFELRDPSEKVVRLDNVLEKGPVVLVFYFGYTCSHCVSQLFALNDDLAKFHELGAEVVAVSDDPPEDTRQRFRKYGDFAFPVLSDPENKVAQAYGVFTPAPKGGEASRYHGTFVIGRDHAVCWAMRNDTPFTDNRTLLYQLARLEGRLPAEKPK